MAGRLETDRVGEDPHSDTQMPFLARQLRPFVHVAAMVVQPSYYLAGRYREVAASEISRADKIVSRSAKCPLGSPRVPFAVGRRDRAPSASARRAL